MKILTLEGLTNFFNNLLERFALKSHTHTASDIGADPSGSASTVQKNLNTLNDEFVEHVGNSDIHFTSTERTKLSGIESGAQKNTITGVKGNAESTYRTGNVNITPANIGLGNVNNTSDANKPVSTAQQTAIDSALSSAKSYADGLIDEIMGEGASDTLNTIGEISAAIEAHQDVTDALNSAIGNKANASDLTSHTGNTTIHVTSSDKSNWNTAYEHSQATHARTDATKVADSTTNGNILINGTETTVYSLPSAGSSLGGVKSGGDVTISSGTITVNDDSHNHTIANVDNLQSTLDSMNEEIDGSIKGLSVSGKTITYTKNDGTTGTITTQDTNTDTKVTVAVDDSGTTALPLLLATGSSAYTGTAKMDSGVKLTPSTNTISANISGNAATASTASAVAWGNVTGKPSSFTPASHNHNDTYYTEAEIDEKVETLETSISSKAASSHTHTIANITNLQSTLDNKAASSHTHNYAGSSSAGGAATSANKLNTNAGSATQPVYFANGVPVATTYTLAKSVPSNAVFTDTNTHYASKNVVGSSTATSNTASALTNGNVYLNSVENGAVTSSHKISGSGATTVTTDTSGNIVISSTDNNTTYSAAGSSLGLVKSGGDVTISSGVITVNDDSHAHTIANVDGLQSALDAKAASSHTHSYAGSSSAGGSATSAVKLDTSTAGDSNTPVYFTGGKPVACTSLDLNTTGSSASCTGNAATATQLATARTIRTNLGSTSTASFNGTANITPGVTGTLPVANGGTGATTAAGAITNLGAMDLTSAQTASGVKTFSNGIKIGSATLSYDSSLGALVISF